MPKIHPITLPEVNDVFNKNNKILNIENKNLFHLAIFTAISEDQDFALIVIELVINKFVKKIVNRKS